MKKKAESMKKQHMCRILFVELLHFCFGASYPKKISASDHHVIFIYE